MEMSLRLKFSLEAICIAVLCLIVCIFFLAGPSYFFEVVWSASLHILGISILAGIVRYAIRRGGHVLSLICGAVIAVVGFFTVLLVATSNI
jgi:hypothetical protein